MQDDRRHTIKSSRNFGDRLDAFGVSNAEPMRLNWHRFALVRLDSQWPSDTQHGIDKPRHLNRGTSLDQ
jgi:hypothetical protein